MNSINSHEVKLVHFAAFTFQTTIETIVDDGPRVELHLVQPEKLAFVKR